MPHLQDEYGLVRIYGTSTSNDGNVTLRLKDRAVELGAKEFASYAKFAEWLPSTRPQTDIESALAMDASRLGRSVTMLEKVGVVYRHAQLPAALTGEEFHRDYFSKFLPSWLG